MKLRHGMTKKGITGEAQEDDCAVRSLRLHFMVFRNRMPLALR